MCRVLPPAFVSHMQSLLGLHEAAQLCEALALDPPVSIRLHPDKLPTTLQRAEPVPWCAHGYYLPRRIPFTFDPLLHAGAYYVQDASSMFLSTVCRQLFDRPVTALDLCAAPGGKSTVLLSSLPHGSVLLSNEVIKSRALVLAENITKWGNPHTLVTQNDPNDFTHLSPLFDCVVADVPCSGEGMFRKDATAIAQWQPDLVTLCAARQRRIVQCAFHALKPGGIFIYSTCTFNTQENEDNVHFIEQLGAQCLPIRVPDTWRITGALDGSTLPVYRFMPHKTRGEGLFFAVLRKEDSGQAPQSKRKKCNFPSLPRRFTQYLTTPTAYSCDKLSDGKIVALPLTIHPLYTTVQSQLRIVQAGIEIGVEKGSTFIPSQSLALTTDFAKASVPMLEVDYDQAITYLQNNPLTLDSEIPKGIVLLTYHTIPLGFVRNVGNRANNLYPKPWKIRSSHRPEQRADLLDFE